MKDGFVSVKDDVIVENVGLCKLNDGWLNVKVGMVKLNDLLTKQDDKGLLMSHVGEVNVVLHSGSSSMIILVLHSSHTHVSLQESNSGV